MHNQEFMVLLPYFKTQPVYGWTNHCIGVKYIVYFWNSRFLMHLSKLKPDLRLSIPSHRSNTSLNVFVLYTTAIVSVQWFPDPIS